MNGFLVMAAMALAGAEGESNAVTTQRVSEQQQVDSALQLTREAARQYEFRALGASRPVQLKEQPILQWSNPEQGQVYGNVFLWTVQGRPAVVGSLFQWFAPHTHSSHEFHSLLDGGLQAHYRGSSVWSIAEPGITLVDVPGRPAVGTTPVLRLAQMRDLARQFTVQRTERNGQNAQLRLLPKPVYRYEREEAAISTGSSQLDGGMFVFVQGTDPELWLLFEAVPGPSGAPPRWQYALARMNSTAFQVQFQQQVVREFPMIPYSEVHSRRLPYTSFRRDGRVMGQTPLR